MGYSPFENYCFQMEVTVMCFAEHFGPYVAPGTMNMIKRKGVMDATGTYACKLGRTDMKVEIVM